jgi:SAM-dependent methyltransferase
MTKSLDGSAWTHPGTVASFVQSPPNATLMRFADHERLRGGRLALDVGCGAGRNALPMAHAGWDVTGTDLSMPMLAAAAERLRQERPSGTVRLALAMMEQLPIRDASIDLIVAHGIWNLARSSAQFRAALHEARRVAKAGASLFVFTFSRSTLPPDAIPVPGESFVFTQFSGQPQCFLTEAQLLAELQDVGFTADDAVPLTEHNRPRPGELRTGGPPVIYEGAFRYVGPNL